MDSFSKRLRGSKVIVFIIVPVGLDSSRVDILVVTLEFMQLKNNIIILVVVAVVVYLLLLCGCWIPFLVALLNFGFIVWNSRSFYLDVVLLLEHIGVN